MQTEDGNKPMDGCQDGMAGTMRERNQGEADAGRPCSGPRVVPVQDALDFVLAGSYATVGNFRMMFECAQRLKHNYDSTPEPYQIEGGALIGMHQERRALNVFLKALERGRHRRETWLGMAHAYEHLNQWEDVTLTLVACVMLDTHDIMTWRRLRLAYLRAGLSQYVSGVDSAMSLLVTRRFRKIPRHALYNADIVGWRYLDGPPAGMPSWDALFEVPAEVAPPV